MPSITGISHIDFSVTDLQRTLGWYRDLFGTIDLFGGRSDHGYDVQYIMEPTSGTIFGFEQHDANDGSKFSERRVGLDHLAFNVANREELDEWLAKLDELGIENSGITEEDPWDVLVFRDPDNIQLEFFLLKADPSTLVPQANP